MGPSGGELCNELYLRSEVTYTRTHTLSLSLVSRFSYLFLTCTHTHTHTYTRMPPQVYAEQKSLTSYLARGRMAAAGYEAGPPRPVPASAGRSSAPLELLARLL